MSVEEMTLQLAKRRTKRDERVAKSDDNDWTRLDCRDCRLALDDTLADEEKASFRADIGHSLMEILTFFLNTDVLTTIWQSSSHSERSYGSDGKRKTLNSGEFSLQLMYSILPCIFE